MIYFRRGEAYAGAVLCRRLYIGWQHTSRRWARLARINSHVWIGPFYVQWGRFAKGEKR